MFEGVYTALITPFRNGSIDYGALEKLVAMQVEGGVDGIVPMGTTGESPTVSFDEHKEFIRRVVGLVKGRVKVIAGTGANSTREAIWLSREAEEAGVDGVLQVNPYYNKPTQRGLIAHFESVAKSITVPVVLYNIPGRTGVNFLPASVKELLDRAGNVVAMKEASGDIQQMMELYELCGERLTLLSGDDNILLPFLSIGGKGVVSVVSNLLPADVKSVVTCYDRGDIGGARERFYRLLPLCRAMFLETNPIPVKAAMAMAGYCTDDLRLPLVPVSDENRAKLRKALLDYGVELK
ncbi:MAG TPA: 4-hydroxy-tetrahydrodipicolinate synthase [Spirochaetota bacterium]|mgnify:CR=1 FL=1|nr:4-hydroxy-tetrahydrodipicolinate synthase [Spirochaetota bacterium]HOD16619.1 4-hydroxy-tetrahydrodipicolinate synthase [Spirochaetota bacterium]HPG49450.1 4-hydroxy-tetrahydrodipicolinate synthase [Spirochaetota bacterium]HPN13802.1 4-hydroxy-tetrahydrodipicolinate synthase [Spirochaetota bacterium]